MGFLTKTKTKTEKIKEKKTFQQIVTLSYLESLALDSGTVSIEDIVGEAQAEEIEVTNENAEEIFGETGKYSRRNSDRLGAIIGSLLGPLGALLGAAFGGLFGKKVTRDVKGTINDSGWNYVRDWKQPYYDIIKYAIGIKELTLSQFNYETTSEIISIAWQSPKDIQKITLLVDQFIPPQFPPGAEYIEYYIKPEGENTEWIRINPLDLPTVYDSKGNIVPRIITFNTERPINAQLETSYITTENPVTAVRFRAVLKRPTEANNGVSPEAYTPILKNYRLVMTPRRGL